MNVVVMEEGRTARLKKQAFEAFLHHHISKRSEGRWLLQRRDEEGHWSWMFAAEIISLAGGALYVGGDIDYCIFAWYSDSANHRAKVRWMGENQDLDYYVVQKAAIGTGRDVVEVYDEETAEAFLRDQIATYGEEMDEDKLEELKALADSPGDEYEFTTRLYEIDPDMAMDCGRCTVTHPRVFFAHAALVRLCKLLDAEKEESERVRQYEEGRHCEPLQP